MRCFTCKGTRRVSSGFLGLGSKPCPDCNGTGFLTRSESPPARSVGSDDNPVTEVADDATGRSNPAASPNAGIHKLDLLRRSEPKIVPFHPPYGRDPEGSDLEHLDSDDDGDPDVDSEAHVD